MGFLEPTGYLGLVDSKVQSKFFALAALVDAVIDKALFEVEPFVGRVVLRVHWWLLAAGRTCFLERVVVCRRV